jgi:hypothetical protein
MAKHTKTDLTIETPKGFRTSIGFTLSDEDKRWPKRFFLGTNKAVAERKATVLQAYWDSLPGDRGVKVWTADKIQHSMQLADAACLLILHPPEPKPQPPQAVQVIPTPPPQPPLAPPPPTPPPASTLHQALDRYALWYERRATENAVSPATATKVKAHVGMIKYYLPDQNLASIDYTALERMRAVFTSRPPGKTNVDRLKTNTIIGLVGALGHMFLLLDRHNEWLPPRHWERAIIIDSDMRRRLHQMDEKEFGEMETQHYTLDELKILWRGLGEQGNPDRVSLVRYWMLLGLCAGWLQSDIAEGNEKNFIQVGTDYFLKKPREKTFAKGKWWIPQELADMLRKHIGYKPEEQEIKQVWERLNRLCVPLGVRKLSFKYLRKTGAQFVQDLSGSHDMAQIFLANGGGDVAARYYTSLTNSTGVGTTAFDRLAEILKKMRQELTTVSICAQNRVVSVTVNGYAGSDGTATSPCNYVYQVKNLHGEYVDVVGGPFTPTMQRPNGSTTPGVMGWGYYNLSLSFVLAWVDEVPNTKVCSSGS